MNQRTVSETLTPALLRAGNGPFELLELFDHVEDLLVWTKDAARRFRWASIPLVLTLGMRHRVQVIGRTDADFCNPILVKQYHLDDERVLKGKRVIARIELIGRFDHVARWYVTSKIPLRNSRGRIVGTAGVAYPMDSRTVFASPEIPLAPAIRFISEHYGESIGNRQLARACGLSVRALERQFRATYHVSPHEYIRQLRVRLSCKALVYSRKPMAQVAMEYGFSDQSHFGKEFRRFFGETPSAYRAQYAGSSSRGS